MEPAQLFNESKVADALSYLQTFSDVAGDDLAAVTWHTYDFRAGELGARRGVCIPSACSPARVEVGLAPRRASRRGCLLNVEAERAPRRASRGTHRS